MELLKFNKAGQWELVKKDTYDYNSYRKRSQTGELPKDTGQRGKLHNTSNTRSDKQMSEPKMEAKVPTPLKTFQEERNPSRQGLDT